MDILSLLPFLFGAVTLSINHFVRTYLKGQLPIKYQNMPYQWAITSVDKVGLGFAAHRRYQEHHHAQEQGHGEVHDGKL